jgi:hypothetical protein
MDDVSPNSKPTSRGALVAPEKEPFRVAPTFVMLPGLDVVTLAFGVTETPFWTRFAIADSPAAVSVMVAVRDTFVSFAL